MLLNELFCEPLNVSAELEYGEVRAGRHDDCGVVVFGVSRGVGRHDSKVWVRAVAGEGAVY